VDVGLGNVRYVVVEDVADVLHVYAACREVGGDQHPDTAGLEIVQRLLARGLRLVPVNCLRAYASAAQQLGQLVCPVLRAREHERPADLPGPEYVHQHGGLLLDIDRHHLLVYQFDDRLVRRDVDAHRVQDHAPCQIDYLRRHCGRKEHRLPVPREKSEYSPDVRYEAHVQHAVGLVQHENLHVLQLDMALPDEVEQPARGRDQYIHAAVQALHLGILADAAVDDRRIDVQIFAVHYQVLVDLLGEFSRRSHDQRPDVSALAPAPVLCKALDYGQRESGGLPGPCLGAAEQVAACEQGRYGLHLHRRGPDVVHVA